MKFTWLLLYMWNILRLALKLVLDKNTHTTTREEIIPAVPTKAVVVVIFVPPAAPVTSSTLPFPSTNIQGTIEDNGRFFGSI